MSDLSAVVPAWGDYVGLVEGLVEDLIAQGVKEVVVVTHGEEVSLPEQARLIHCRQGSSVGETRNAGLQAARGEFVVFCDADDRPYPASYELMMQAFAPGVVLVTGKRVLEDGREYEWPSERVFKSGRVSLISQWIWNSTPLNTGTIIRKSALRKVGGWPDYSLAEDGTLASALRCVGEFRFLDTPTCVYGLNPQGLYQQGRSFKEWLSAFRFQREWLRDNPAVPAWLARVQFLLVPLQTASAVELARRGASQRRAWREA